MYLQAIFNYLSFETEKCACFEVGNEFKYNPEDYASTSVVVSWSLVFGRISQESWFDSWQRWKIFFIFNPPSPALELMRLQVHWALGASSSEGTVDHPNLELRSKVSACYSAPTYDFMARTVTTLPLLYCQNQECLQLKRLSLPSPQLQTHQPVHSHHVCVQSSDINPTKALVRDFKMGASPNSRKASSYRELFLS